MPFAEPDFSGREYRITKIFQYNIYYGQIVTIALQSELTNDTTRTNVDVIAVAMSGGVDSSVVAALMQEQSRTVIGLTMQLWNQRRLPTLQSAGPAQHRCCSIDDVYDAKR